MLGALQGLLGAVAIPLLAWAMSEDRKLLPPREMARTILVTLMLQLAIAVVLLKVPSSSLVFAALAAGVRHLQAATETGMQLVFGYLAGGTPPFSVTDPKAGFILAFRALPLILIMSVLSRLLYCWGILQLVVGVVAWALKRLFGIGGALGTASAANVFLGMVDAPLLIRPYLRTMGRGALFATMAVGMATVAGTVMALYASILEPVLPGATCHLLAASLMSVPGALMLSRLAVPNGFTSELQEPAGGDGRPATSMQAITEGTFDGLKLLASVAAMLVVMVALVSLANAALAGIGTQLGVSLTLQGLIGHVAAPFAWLIGIPWHEASQAGALIGQKLVLNELIAYLELAKLPASALSERSRVIVTYALCGFANLGSLGIMVGGLVAMAPDRKAEILELAPRAVLIGAMSTMLAAAVVGLVVW